MIAAATIRALRPADVKPLAGVLVRAYESPHNFELPLLTYLRMSTVATFVADVDGAPAGIVIGHDYGTTAYVAMMAVDPPLQRRGIAGALMSGLSAWARERRFVEIELDATPSGASLYARFGFAAAGETLVYHAGGRGGNARAARPYHAGDRAGLLTCDRRAFGSDRSDVLQPLLESSANAVVVTGPRGEIAGYAVAQPRSDLLGPVIAPDGAVAERLIDAARTRLPATHRLNVPGINRAAQTILVERGYRFTRSLAHMRCGTGLPAARHMVFARINLGQG